MMRRNAGIRFRLNKEIPPFLQQYGAQGSAALDLAYLLIEKSRSESCKVLRLSQSDILECLDWMTDTDLERAIIILEQNGFIRIMSDMEGANSEHSAYIALMDSVYDRKE